MDGKERLEAAAEEKYPLDNHVAEIQRAAYIRGRLDQAEADAQMILSTPGGSWEGNRFAAAIRKGVE